jgi:ketosteroid isomerase-like protein
MLICLLRYSLTSSAKTDAQGSIIYVTSVETVSASSSSTTSLVDDVTSLETVFASASATGNSSAVGASQSATSGDGKVLSTGVIIAISVVGGVVVLAIGLFIVWKLKQKKFNGYDDDSESVWS